MLLVWKDEPVMGILDSISHPIDEVEFPTVTLCPKTLSSDRFGALLKAFDYTNPHFDSDL